MEVWLVVKGGMSAARRAVEGEGGGGAEGGLQLLPGTRTNETKGMGMLREARRLRLEIDEGAKRARFLSIT